MKQSNKQLIYYFVGILAVVGVAASLIFTAGTKKGGDETLNGSAYSIGVLTALENDYSFGTINMKDGDVSHRFALKNNSDKTVKIGNVSTSCMCTTAYLYDGTGARKGPFGMPGHGGKSFADLEIGVGEVAELEAVFDPAAHGPQGVGKVKRVINIETDSQTNPKIQLTFEAEIIN